METKTSLMTVALDATDLLNMLRQRHAQAKRVCVALSREPLVAASVTHTRATYETEAYGQEKAKLRRAA
ncbi:unnamed protein product [Vitrella brassicaformis CCMP3155]|uniref:Uncharacterized protein n=1 Tax=Vitrella brassicaformis (strain CCMP3155) TaxID=1169540 RepID=A0A0G4EPA7_VITBC|nr:unnamed protein product [Vitrella brassicaformis CCMP3155]|eukprot:CEL99286.1 unnamed protein product [Vitrella brassicaformis CCMP3155]